MANKEKTAASAMQRAAPKLTKDQTRAKAAPSDPSPTVQRFTSGTGPGAPEGRQPEALASLAAAARSGGRKPDAQGLTARGDTGPIGTSPASKHNAATKVLHEGAFGDDAGADEAVQKLPDRTKPRRT